MQLKELNNLRYQGAAGRRSLLDIIYPESQEKLPVLFFIHGFKGFKDWGCFPLFTRRIAEEGYAVVKFNFSHNGGTSENPIDFPDLEAFSNNTYSKELEDVAHVYQWLNQSDIIPREVMNLDSIGLLGHSRGGAIALLAASKYSWVKRVMTMAAVADLEKRLPSHDDLRAWKESGLRYIQNARTNQAMPMKYAFVEDLKKNSQSLNVKKAVESLRMPQLILHGDADETINVDDAHLLKSWNSNAEIKIIKDAGHTFNGKHPWQSNELPSEMEDVLVAIRSFLDNSV